MSRTARVLLRTVAPLLLLLIPGAAAAPQFFAVVPDLEGPGPGDEGFALISDQDWDLTGWQVADGEGAWSGDGFTLAANEPLWLTGNQTSWNAHDGPPAVEWSDTNLRLSNSGEELSLLNPSGNVAQRFDWTNLPKSPGLAYRYEGDWATPRMHRIGESDLGPAPTFTADGITAYASPDSTYDVLRALMDGANTRLIAHVYAFGQPELADGLADAARRGVDVHVLVDGNVVGTSADDRAETDHLLATIRAAGGTTVASGNDVYRHHHLKVLVADDAVAIQSENWVATGVPTDPTWGNRGWGTVVHDDEMAAWFAEWMADDRARWDTEPVDSAGLEPWAFPPNRGSYQPVSSAFFPGPIQVTPIVAPDHSAAGGPLDDALAAATTRIWAQQLSMDLRESNGLGWDAPDRHTTALSDAAGRGVDVRLQLAAPFGYDDTDNRDVRDALRASGAEASLWDHPSLGTLHNKGWIIDDSVVVGSMNGHHASRSNNREVSVLISSPEVTGYYAALFEADSAQPALWIPSAPVPILLALIAVAALRRC